MQSSRGYNGLNSIIMEPATICWQLLSEATITLFRPIGAILFVYKKYLCTSFILVINVIFFSVHSVSVYGSPRRCGGQGDVLSGRYYDVYFNIFITCWSVCSEIYLKLQLNEPPFYLAIVWLCFCPGRVSTSLLLMAIST